MRRFEDLPKAVANLKRRLDQLERLASRQGHGHVLGYAEVTSDQLGLTGGPAGLSGLAPTVTVPANRVIKITGKVNMQLNGTGRLLILIRDSSTILTRIADFANHTSGQRDTAYGSVVVEGPSAGDHNYNVAYQLVSGTSFDSEATSTNPAFILAEDLGST